VWWPGDKKCSNAAHACRIRRLKWVPSTWGTARSPCLRRWQIRRPGPPVWGLGVRLTAPARKNPAVWKSKEGYGP
jgi:hypothetical protein